MEKVTELLAQISYTYDLFVAEAAKSVAKDNASAATKSRVLTSTLDKLLKAYRAASVAQFKG